MDGIEAERIKLPEGVEGHVRQVPSAEIRVEGLLCQDCPDQETDDWRLLKPY